MIGRLNSTCVFFKHETKIINILSRLSDFVTCSTCFNIWSEGSTVQLLNRVGDQI